MFSLSDHRLAKTREEKLGKKKECNELVEERAIQAAGFAGENE
jgi:hypothetical protein